MELCQYPCQNKYRFFTVEAIQIPIVYNRYGDYDPDGLLYVLEEDFQRIQEEAMSRFRQTPPQPYEEVQPLVLRVNLGDTVKVCFRHRLNRRLSIHVQGLDYDEDHRDQECGDCKACLEINKKCDKVKVFEIALVQAKLTYNSYGWHDPEGRFFVLKEDLERHGGLESYIRMVEEGKIQVEPLVIRANAGDCIELRTTNLLPEFLEENAFQLKTRTDIAGYHVHLVKFDTITSDWAANGWNNIAGARKYETLVERFFADEELQTVFFHDHLFANAHQLHGMFGALVIEEAGATFHDIRTGGELHSGTQAVIRRRDGTSFREFALFVHL